MLKEKAVRHPLTAAQLVVLMLAVSAVPAPAARSDAAGSATVVSAPGLPQEPIQPLSLPKDLDARKVKLGRQLFNDPRLSSGDRFSCASCHDLDDNGADHLSLTPGRDGAPLSVNTPTLFNSSLNHRLFWDGRAASLEAQIDFVVTSRQEFASSWPEIIARLEQDKSYIKTFRKIYPDSLTASNIRDAIATFERTLITVNSRFDRYLLGDADAITPEERTGYQLFKDYGCAACHQGRNVGGNLFMKFGVFGNYFTDRGNITRSDLGRFNVTGDEHDKYAFRVPSLRLVALTAPYFHDGSTKTLSQAIRIMAKHQLGREIPDQDIEYIEAFLKTLPGDITHTQPRAAMP